MLTVAGLLAGPAVAADLVPGGWPSGAPARVASVAGCGGYGTYDCQLVPRLGDDGRPGPVYEGGPRCVWRVTPLGTRRLCRAF